MQPQLLEIEFYFVPEAFAGVIDKYLPIVNSDKTVYRLGMVEYYAQKFGKNVYHRNIGLFADIEAAASKIDSAIIEAANLWTSDYQLYYKIKFNELVFWELVPIGLFVNSNRGAEWNIGWRKWTRFFEVNAFWQNQAHKQFAIIDSMTVDEMRTFLTQP